MLAVAAHSPNLASRAEGLAAEPEVSRWARICAWIPGTGHCQNRDCSLACAFRSQREAEKRAITRWRRLRRIFARRSLR